MIRNSKILGLVMVVLLTLGAATAPGAVAQLGKTTSANGQAFTLNGKEVGVEGKGFTFTGAFGVTVYCPGSTWAGHKTSDTPHSLIQNGATSMTVSLKPFSCKAGGSVRFLNMNGCDYVLHDATTVKFGTYAIKTDIVCSLGSIEITGGACNVAFGSQSNLAGLHATNEFGGITIKGEVKMKVKICGFTETTATQDLFFELDGYNPGTGLPVNVSISD